MSTKVTQDAYTWQVTYEDDTVVPEYENERPDGRVWAEVDQGRVCVLSLLGSDRAYSVSIPAGAAPVFFRRRRLILSLEVDSVTSGETIHCIGWKHDENGVYLFVWDSGHVLLTDDLQAV